MNLNKISIYFLKFVVILIVILEIILSLLFVPKIANFAGDLRSDLYWIEMVVYIVLYGIIITYFYIFFLSFQLLHLIEKKMIFTELSLGKIQKIKFSSFIAICIGIAGFPLFRLFLKDLDPPMWFFTAPVIMPILITISLAHIFENLTKEILNFKK